MAFEMNMSPNGALEVVVWVIGIIVYARRLPPTYTLTSETFQLRPGVQKSAINVLRLAENNGPGTAATAIFHRETAAYARKAMSYTKTLTPRTTQPPATAHHSIFIRVRGPSPAPVVVVVTGAANTVVAGIASHAVVSTASWTPSSPPTATALALCIPRPTIPTPRSAPATSPHVRSRRAGARTRVEGASRPTHSGKMRSMNGTSSTTPPLNDEVNRFDGNRVVPGARAQKGEYNEARALYTSRHVMAQRPPL